MAHFAKIKNNIVTEVLVVDNENEENGEDFLNNLFNTNDRWIKTSYNNNFRGVFAGIGYIYDSERDVFIPPIPINPLTNEKLTNWVYNQKYNEYYPNEPYPNDAYDSDGNGFKIPINLICNVEEIEWEIFIKDKIIYNWDYKNNKWVKR